MYRTLLLPFLIFFCLTIFAQTSPGPPTVTVGPELGQRPNTHTYTIVDFDEEGGLYALNSTVKKLGGPPTFMLSHYNADLRQEASVRLSLAEREFEESVAWGEHLLILSSAVDKKTKSHNLYATPHDRTSLKPVASPKVIFSAPQPEGLISKMYKTSAPARFRIRLTPDSSRLVVVYNGALPVGGMKVFPPKKKPGSVTAALFDQQLDAIWQRHYELPTDDYAYALFDFITDNTGAVSLLYHYKARPAKHRAAGKGLRNDYFKFWRLAGNNGELSVTDINAEGRSLGGLSLAAAPSGSRIAVAGYYAEQTKALSFEGTACFWVDPANPTKVSAVFDAFPAGVLNVVGKGRAKSIDNLAPIHHYLNDDGQSLLLGEQRNLSDPTTGSSSLTREMDDLVVSRISVNRSRALHVRVPKKQRAGIEDSPSLSAAILKKGDDVLLFFNDNRDNVGKQAGDKLMPFYDYHKHMVTVMVTVGVDGAQRKEVLFSGEDTDVVLRPDLLHLTPAGDILAFGHWKKINRFFRITVPGLNATAR